MSEKEEFSIVFETIEPGNRDACDFLSALHTQIFSGSFERPWSSQDFYEILAMPFTSIKLILVNDNCAGFVVYSIIQNEMELLSIGLLAEFRSQGIGKQSFRQLLSTPETQSARSIYLEVRSNNKNALTFYRHLGFESISKRPDYYHLTNGEKVDAVVMKIKR